VTVMGTLTSNLHVLMTSFYNPTKTRYKILIESKAFPSDYFAVESQLKLHGHGLDGLLTVEPDSGANIITTEKILDTINTRGHEIACVMLSGVHYYSGQLFDMARITEAAHAKVCIPHAWLASVLTLLCILTNRDAWLGLIWRTRLEMCRCDCTNGTSISHAGYVFIRCKQL